MTTLLRLALSCCLISLAACSRGTSSTPSTLNPGQTATVVPSFSIYYQPIKSGQDLSKLGKVNVIVTSRQLDDAAAVKAIHAHGAKAFRYIQSYWFPSGQTYDGLDIGKHLDWADCTSGSDPLLGRVQGGHQWYFLDANERAARQWFVDLLHTLRSEGYDGVMFDRGLAALTGVDNHAANIWYRPSTCTQNPVSKGATPADAYVGLMREVHKAGLQLFQNYGLSPFDPGNPFRPDPSDPACQRRQYATCRHVEDGIQSVDYFLDEAVAHPKDANWRDDYAANLAGEHDRHFGGKIVGVITQGTLGGDVSRAAVFFEFARVRLFNVPVAIFTGDKQCSGGTGVCNRQGLYPELATADFGRPFGTEPQSVNCISGSSVNCVWVRQYEHAISAVNVSDTAAQVTIKLAAGGCQHVTDLESGTPLEQDRCVSSVSLQLAPWSGRPLLLRKSG